MENNMWKKSTPISETDGKSTGVTVTSGTQGTNPIDHLMNLSLEEKEAKLGELWKVFGINTAAGKSLYQMFGNRYKQKISYPTPKTKP